jgi:dihydrofolate reductase
MRRVRLFIATSLDGYIAGRDDDLGWLFDDADYGYAAFYDSIDTVLVGRRTYDVAQSFAQWPYAGRRVVVFTRTGEARVTSPDTVATPRSPADVVAELRARPGKDLWLAGGGALVRSFMAAALIDDMIISIHPVLLGEGIPLAGDGAPRVPLTLVGERRYPSGLMQLSYRVDRA